MRLGGQGLFSATAFHGGVDPPRGCVWKLHSCSSRDGAQDSSLWSTVLSLPVISMAFLASGHISHRIGTRTAIPERVAFDFADHGQTSYKARAVEPSRSAS